MIPKFRAWDREDKVMREVAGIHWGINVIEFFDEDLDSDTYDIDKYDVMQYAPMYDKNDVQICEGDIVVTYARVSKIVHHLGALGMISCCYGFESFGENDNFVWTDGKSAFIEVVGNIYEVKKIDVGKCFEWLDIYEALGWSIHESIKGELVANCEQAISEHDGDSVLLYLGIK